MKVEITSDEWLDIIPETMAEKLALLYLKEHSPVNGFPVVIYDVPEKQNTNKPTE